MSYKFSDVAVEVKYHLLGIASGFKTKALLTMIPAVLSLHFGIDWRFFETWLFFILTDLALGVALGLATPGEIPGTTAFSRARLSGWVVKALTHATTILIVGILSTRLSDLIGVQAAFVNLFIFWLIVSESASVMRSAVSLGLPVPPIAQTIIHALSRRVEKKLSDAANLKSELTEETNDRPD